ncbi:MAG TPA: DUF4112 domain-containing protein [Longimicrobiales bacterium]|nr:DUF4112 domain-containing protein [Longimicrobiales bacterium]
MNLALAHHDSFTLRPPDTCMNRRRELEGLRALARVMDDAVTIPGTRFRIGLDALIGLVPGLGDVAGGVTAAYALVVAQRLGAPRSVLLRMVGNVLVDAVVGAVPALGDVFDAAYRANRRNVQLLERFAVAPARTERSSKLFLGLVLALLALVLISGIMLAFVVTRAIGRALF